MYKIAMLYGVIVPCLQLTSFSLLFLLFISVLYDSCPKTYASGIWWTRTKFGVVRIELCPPGSVGNATRTCKDNADGWLPPVLTGCTSSGFVTLNVTVS